MRRQALFVLTALERLQVAAAAIAVAGTLVLADGRSAEAGSSPARKSSGPISRAAAQADRRRLTAAACYAPQQLRVAYGIQPLLDRGTDGRGQTVVLSEFAKNPSQPEPPQSMPISDMRQDLALFDAMFGLPAARPRADPSLAGSAFPWLASGVVLAGTEDTDEMHRRLPARRRSACRRRGWLDAYRGHRSPAIDVVDPRCAAKALHVDRFVAGGRGLHLSNGAHPHPERLLAGILRVVQRSVAAWLPA